MSAPYQEVPKSHRRCGECKKEFQSRQGLSDHFNMKHGRNPLQEDFLPVEKKPKPESAHESFADRAIAASLAIAMGENTDDAWLLP